MLDNWVIVEQNDLLHREESSVRAFLAAMEQRYDRKIQKKVR